MADSTTPQPAAAPMTAAAGVVMAAGVVGLMRKHGLITPDDRGFDLTRTATVWASFGKDVLELLEEQGVAVPPNVHKAVEGVAFYMPIIQALLAQQAH